MIDVRRAKPGDDRALATLDRATWTTLTSPAPPPPEPDWSFLNEKVDIRDVLVAELDGEVAGWAALSAVSDRCCYAGVAEVSVYVAAAARGHGVGTALLSALVASSEVGGVWTLEAGILPENEASVRMHERCGFRVVGRRERLGRMDGEWRDVLLLERRSRVAG